MSKKRVYELAKELGIENKELISRMEKIGIVVRSHTSTIEDGDVQKIQQELLMKEGREMVEKRIKTTVIRRRAVGPVIEAATPETAKEQAKVGPESIVTETTIITTTVEKERKTSEEPIKEVEPVIIEPQIKVIPEEPAPPKSEMLEEIAVDKDKDKDDIVVVADAVEDALKTVEKQPFKVVSPEISPLSERDEILPPKIVEETELTITLLKEKVVEKKELPVLQKAQPEKNKFKAKRSVEVIMEELPGARKKAFIKKIVDKKERRVDKYSEEKLIAWREGKKQPPIKMKKTVVTIPKAIKKRIKIAESIPVGELAKKMGVKASEIISKLIGFGLMVSINQSIDYDAAAIIASEFGYQVEPAGAKYEEAIQKEQISSANLKPRAPVVTIMGHVDHGKTSLLDAIRQTNVMAGEAGGITQAIGAYHVNIKNRDIVFLDTPGHEAFTAMRARGANVTDIVVLVVAADDGVREQTIEAINHAKVAGVPIIVAINKMDKPGADPGRIRQVLSEYDLVPEEWGGSTIYCEVSAKKKEGIEEMLELILLQADIMGLEADPDRPARGVIIESKLDRGRGPVATVLIQSGTLREGDAFVSKTEVGKVRALINDKGHRVKEAGPSIPVEVIGFSGVPQVGAEFFCVEDEKKARSIGEYWIRKERERELSASTKITLEQLYQKIKEGFKEFNVIIKGDVQGSVEALSEALNKLSTKDIKLKIIHSSTGSITETDVMLASASNAVIIGFNVRPNSRVLDVAADEGVEIKLYEIIYDVITDMKAAIDGLLEPVYKEVIIGRAEVRELFKVPKVGIIAGSHVKSGKIAKASRVKLVRDGILIFDGKILSLRRFKDDVKEVIAGYECGIGIEGFNDIKVGDVIESYIQEKVETKL